MLMLMLLIIIFSLMPLTYLMPLTLRRHALLPLRVFRHYYAAITPTPGHAAAVIAAITIRDAFIAADFH